MGRDLVAGYGSVGWLALGAQRLRTSRGDVNSPNKAAHSL
jgi:hypothetical protein